jgi:hypothetical protein
VVAVSLGAPARGAPEVPSSPLQKPLLKDLTKPLAPAEPAPVSECFRVKVETSVSSVLASAGAEVVITVAQSNAVPSGASVLLYRSDGLRRSLPLDASARTTGRATIAVPVDTPPGSYELGLVDAAGARWVSFGPRPKLAVVPSRRVGALVAVQFPCTMDVTSLATAQLWVKSGALATQVSLTRFATAVDAAGITIVSYRGNDLVPTGPISVLFTPGTPVTLWEGRGYATSSQCRSHTRFLKGLSLTSTPTPASPGNRWFDTDVKDGAVVAATFDVTPGDNTLSGGGMIDRPAAPALQLPCE